MVVRNVSVTELGCLVASEFVTSTVDSAFVSLPSYQGVVRNVQTVPMICKTVACLDVLVSASIEQFCNDIK